jgi:hypothetical protein
LKKSTDIHYTPPEVAERLAALLPPARELVIFDPAAGEGSLLDSAASLLGAMATIYGADLDERAVRILRTSRPAWTISTANALSSRSRRSSRAWRLAVDRGVDCVVMNPPFSFRGFGGVFVEFGGKTHKATPAVAFVATALSELRPTVGVFCILPRGSVHGERDRSLWDAIDREWSVTIHTEFPRGTFPAAAATSMLVSIRPRPSGYVAKTSIAAVPDRVHGCICVEVVRGRVSVARRNAAGPGLSPWVHTRDLSEGRAVLQWTGLPRTLATAGPLVTIPRVGKFDQRKIVELARRDVILSDCLFGVRAPRANLAEVHAAIKSSGEALEARYFGTGAPHITTGRIVDYLQSLGFSPNVVSAGAARSECHCSAKREVGAAPERLEN